MKLFVVVAVALLACANANVLTDTLKDLGNTVKHEFQLIKDTVTPVAAQMGQSVIEQLKQAGKNVLANLLSSLSTFGASSKRDVASILASGEQMLEKLGNKANTFFQHAMGKLAEIADKVHNLKIFGQPIENIIKEIDSIVESHGRLQLANIVDVLGNFMHKRSTFSDFGNVVGDMFNKFHDTVKTFASELKEGIKPHIDALKQVFSTVVQQGKDTIGALKAAATDILEQTKQNAAPAIQQLGETGKDAIHVIGQHLIKNLLG